MGHEVSTSSSSSPLDNNNKSPITTEVTKHLNNFNLALLDDLSMPRAAASLFAIVKLAESHFKQIKKEQGNDIHALKYDLDGIRAIQYALIEMDRVFGIFYTVPDDNNTAKDDDDEDSSVPNEVIELVEQRMKAKEAKEWDLADTLRNQVLELRFAIKDVKEGDPLISRVE